MCGFGFTKYDFPSQLDMITNQTIFTPAVDGDFLVMLYVELFDVNGVGENLSFSISWTDTIGVVTLPLGTWIANGLAGGGASRGQTVAIHALAGQPITFSTTVSNHVSPLNPFNVYFTVIGG